MGDENNIDYDYIKMWFDVNVYKDEKVIGFIRNHFSVILVCICNDVIYTKSFNHIPDTILNALVNIDNNNTLYLIDVFSHDTKYLSHVKYECDRYLVAIHYDDINDTYSDSIPFLISKKYKNIIYERIYTYENLKYIDEL